MLEKSPKLHEEELRTEFQDPPKVYLTRFESMSNYIIDEYSEEDLTKRYRELVSKDIWDEMCRNCRMPFLLHNGACTRSKEAGPLKSGKILDERDKFMDRMRLIIKRETEREEKWASVKDSLIL